MVHVYNNNLNKINIQQPIDPTEHTHSLCSSLEGSTMTVYVHVHNSTH